jgi:hypothetical protein
VRFLIPYRWNLPLLFCWNSSDLPVQSSVGENDVVAMTFECKERPEEMCMLWWACEPCDLVCDVGRRFIKTISNRTQPQHIHN